MFLWNTGRAGGTSVEEIPRKTEVNGQGIDGIMGSPERVAASGVYMVDSSVEPTMFQMEIQIGIAYRVVADFHSVLSILGGELSDDGGIVRCIIGSEVAYVPAQLYP